MCYVLIALNSMKCVNPACMNDVRYQYKFFFVDFQFHASNFTPSYALDDDKY